MEVSIQAASSGGAAVKGLRAEDLLLSDNNQPQAIRTFERVGTLAEARGRHSPDRHSILLLDALNTDWSDQFFARRAAAKALAQIPAGERVAIFLLASRGLMLLRDFSSDPAGLRALVQHLSGEVPENGQVSADSPFSAAFSSIDMTRPAPPHSGPWAAFRQRQKILDTFAAIKAIARLAKPLPGQKNLLWLSSAFPLTIRTSGAAGTGASMLESFHDDAAQTARELNAANLTIYPIDARGLSLNSRAHINIDSMKELAEQTGGRAFYNSNDLPGLIRAAFEESGNGYVLTYAPSDLRDDGKYHTIRLRAARHGVHLRYRPGYYADAPRPRKR